MTTSHARTAVEDLLLEYVAILDAGRVEEWPTLFTERCVYRIQSRGSLARGLPASFYFCDSRAMLEDRVLALRQTAVHVDETYRHILNRTRIVSVDGDIVRAETGVVVYRTIQGGQTELFASGVYVDTVVLDPSGAKFRDKLVVTDSDGFDMYLLAPL